MAKLDTGVIIQGVGMHYKFTRLITLVFIIAIASSFPSFASNAKWIPTIKIRHQLSYPLQVHYLYKDNADTGFWHLPRARVEFLHQLWLLSLTEKDSFLKDRYHKLISLDLNPHTDVEFDIIATDTLLNYLSYIENLNTKGKLWLYSGKIPAQLPKVSPKTYNNLKTALLNDSLLNFLKQLIPNYAKNLKFEQEIFRLSQIRSKWNVIPCRVNIAASEKFYCTNILTKNLQALNYLSLDNKFKFKQKDTYPKELVEPIKQFQKQHNIQSNGKLNYSTIEQLNISPRARIKSIALNIQRQHLYKNYNGKTKIIVNIPQYKLFLYKQNKLELETPVIVGKTKTPTPMLNLKLKSIILNPNWWVPKSINAEFLYLAMASDPEYALKFGYRIYKRENNALIEMKGLDPSSINWLSLSPSEYTFIQSASEFSALGRFKFNTPNRHSIYLHDTPVKTLFNKNRRAFSHGCIRVKNPQNLAGKILSYNKINPNKIEANLKDFRSKVFKLKNNIPVYITYLTAWVNQDGNITYANDIYGYDK